MNAANPQAVPDTWMRPESRPAADAETPALWRVGLLGGLDLSDGSQHITRLPSRAVTALLARLALAPERAHAREELIELLWPGVALGVGRNRLRQALSTLKGVLEPTGRVPPQPVLLADRISCELKFTVEAAESLETPAGKFDTLRLVAKGFANKLTTGSISRQERTLWLAPAAKREVKYEIRTILKNNTVFKSEGRELLAFKAGGA